MERSEWDEALAAHTNELVDQLLAAERHAAPRESLLPVVQDLRRFIEETAKQRAASPTLATTIQLVLNPCLHEFYPRDESDATLEELLEIFCALGQGQPAIVRVMQELGTFHELAWVAMRPATRKAAANCLGRLANSPDRAGIAAQLAILQSGIEMEGPAAPPDPSQPESSAAGAARSQSESSPLPLLYQLLIADDTQAHIAAVNMLQALVNNIGEAQAVQQKYIATYGNGAILLHLTAKVQQLCIDHTSSQARQELGHMLQLLTNLAEDCKPAQDRLARMGLLESLLGLVFDHHGTASRLHLKHAIALLAALQQCHTANQAIVLPHAHHLTDALAAILQALSAAQPSPASRQAGFGVVATDDALQAAQQYRHAADLLARIPVEGQRSALHAELQAHAQESHTNRPVRGQRSALHAELQAQAEVSHTNRPEGSNGSDSIQADIDMALLLQLKQACYSMLLYLPASELQSRSQFWVDNAEGLPFLLRCTLVIATNRDARVRNPLLAVQAINALTNEWASNPEAATMLRSLAYHRCLLEGLVQAVRQEEDIGSATDAIRTMELLMKQGPDVGDFLLASDAAEALAQVTLKMTSKTLFDSHRQLSNCIVSLISTKARAADIVRMCQTAILESTSSLIRNRAMDIMRAIARLVFDLEDQVIRTGSPERAEQAVAEAKEEERHLPGQQMQNVVDMATSLASLIYSTAQNPPVTRAGATIQTGAGSTTQIEHGAAASVEHDDMPMAAPVQEDLTDATNAELSSVAASPITQRSIRPASAAQDTAAAIPHATQDAGAAIDAVLQVTSSTSSLPATLPVSVQHASAQEVLAPVGSAQLALTPHVSAPDILAAGTSAPRLPAHDALAQDVLVQDASAQDVSAQDAAAALAGRQQAANKAVDELTTQISSMPAESADATVLAAAAGSSPVAAALRQQIVEQALQELFEAQHSSSHSRASDDVQSSTGAPDAATHLDAAMATPAPVSPASAAVAILVGTATAAALQRRPATEQAPATQFAEPEKEQELTFASSDESSDDAAARQYALDKAIDELIFPDRSSSDSAASSGSSGGASQSTSSSHAAEEEEVPPSSLGSSSSNADSQADSAADSATESDESSDEDEGASAEDARAQLHDSLTAALQALQQRAGYGSDDDQPRIPSTTSQFAGTARAVVAPDAASGPLQTPAIQRAAARQRQGILGLPSLRLVSSRTRRTTEGEQPSDTGLVPVSSQESPADAEVLQAYTDMQRRAAQAMQADDDDSDDDDVLWNVPHQPVNCQVMEEQLQHRDQTPRRLIASEQEREGDAWKHKVPPFYAVHSMYSNGHVAGVRQQTQCRRQIGFPRSRKNMLRRVFRGALAVAAVALTAGVVSNKGHRHAGHDSSTRNNYASDFDESESESDEDCNYSHRNNNAVHNGPDKHGTDQAEYADSSSENDLGPMPGIANKLHGVIAKLRVKR